MFSSTIIPTINRPTLSRAVQSVLNQDFSSDDFEVIVVNDSGQPLPFMAWQNSKCVRIINTNRCERSVARNAGAAIATGKYLHFLDDDDLLLPGALNAFWQLCQRNECTTWLNGSYQTIDNNGNIVEEIYPEHQGNNFAMLVAGEGIPLQASLLEATQFHKVGAFDPIMIGVEDRDLSRRIAMIGKISYTNFPVAQIRIGLEGSTTNWSSIAEDDRRSREKVLNLSNSFYRLWDSTKFCVWHGKLCRAYWQGRVCRAYIASILWNLQNRNLLAATSRLIYCFVFAIRNLFSSDFWLGLRKVDPLRQ
jgi:glycosyltransferase involved in cell wall biosynthesis